ncbi:IS3 family transposase [Anaerocolumna sp. MB42-C2]|nr:IS3 family transposase [Anaerocolumna sp. MB42-C2]WMJ90415.1 hypothetical protein RBU59_13045 [Anaerocolumna sp. MB42-C2]
MSYAKNTTVSDYIIYYNAKRLQRKLLATTFMEYHIRYLEAA